jgi:gliding motility-associated-like protein
MSNVYIYNKFGKLLAQLDAQEEGWYGLFNVSLSPSADYWCKIQLEDGRVHTGHFSLIRR